MINYFRIIPYLTKIAIRSYTNWYLLGSISVYGYEFSQLEKYCTQHTWNKYIYFVLTFTPNFHFPLQFSISTFHNFLPPNFHFPHYFTPNFHFPNPDTPPPPLHTLILLTVLGWLQPYHAYNPKPRPVCTLDDVTHRVIIERALCARPDMSIHSYYVPMRNWPTYM